MKKNRKINNFSFLLLLISFNGIGQNTYNISGTVTDKSNIPIEVGDALILNPKDSTIIKYSYITNGKFVIESVAQGDHSLKITSLGYKEVSIDIQLNENKNLSIVLEEESVDLDEVVIKSRKNIFENKNGNVKVNVENTILSSEPSSINLLAKLPNIQVSPDQSSVSFIGRGNALIYLGNQRLSIEELTSISVSDIKNIEIIKYPSAKYEAEGRTVILITPKNNFSQGFKVDVHETLAFKRNLNNYAGMYMSLRKNKLELKVDFDYNELELWEKNGFNFEIQNQNIESGYEVVANTDRPQFKVGAGVFYKINDGDYLFYKASIRTIDDFYPIQAESFLQQNGNLNNIITRNIGEEQGTFFSNNLNYNNSFPKINGNLFIGAQFSKLSSDENNDISDEFDNSGVLERQQREQIYDVDAVSGQIDFEKTFKNDIKFEIGSKIVNAEAKTDFRIIDTEQPENSSNSIYDYSEINYAAYTQLSGMFNKIGYSLGLRTETTEVEGGFVGENIKLVDSTYTNLFPKVRFEIPLDSTKVLTMNYAKSINRPNYSNASQLNVYINPFLVIQGNLNLRPTITDEVSLSFSTENKTINLSYSESKGPIFLSPFYDENDNLLNLIYTNLDKSKTWTLSLTYPLKYKFWSSHNILSGYYNIIEDRAAVVEDSKPFLYVYSGNEFSLPKGYSISLSGWGITKRYEGAFVRKAVYVVDFGVSKTFFKKLNCSVNVNDIFKSIKYQDDFTFNDIQSRGTYFVDYRGIFLSLKYSFGDIKESSYKNKEIDGSSRMN